MIINDRKIIGVIFVTSLVLLYSCTFKGERSKMSSPELAAAILKDASLLKVESMANDLLGKGFDAGGGYPHVWIRDMNTFIETSCEVYDKREIQGALLTFFHLQQDNGEIVDGYIAREYLDPQAPSVYTSTSDKRHVGFKNNVKTDQESSLISAVGKYIGKTGDKAILDFRVAGKTVKERMALSIEYLLQNRYSSKYGLIISATTQDWGDVQPEDSPGVRITENTHWSCDIYNNAMFIIALDTMLKFSTTSKDKRKWSTLKERIATNVRKYLWDSKRIKFIPHVYLKLSPFPADFDESVMHFHGGTAVAIEAGLLSKDEIAAVNRQMLENVKRSGAPSIGLNIYPPYPKGFFKNQQTNVPYTYQNGGDWTWFGGRMIQQLIANGFVQEGYDEVRPMIDRVIKYNGFHEWYRSKQLDIKWNGIRWYGSYGKPQGSADYRGEAGVLAKAIRMLREWAVQETHRHNAKIL